MTGNGEKRKILIVPSIRKGNGSGHLRRAVTLAVELLDKGAETAVLIDSASHRAHACYTSDDAAALIPEGCSRNLPLLNEAVPADWDICIFDTRETPPQRLSAFSGRTVSIGLDEGGDARAYFDYLIDILPNIETSTPNISSPGFLRLPPQPEPFKSPLQPEAGSGAPKIKKVLISFGGEDGADLTGKLIRMIEDNGFFALKDLTVVKGPFFRKQVFPSEVTVLDAPADLGMLLKDYDLVFTLFGLTCFEALYSLTPVILFNPTAYHRNLSVRAGIPEIGIHKPDAAECGDYLGSTMMLYKAVEMYSGIENLNLADYILGLDLHLQKCRGCGRKHHRIIERSREYSFFKCSNCGLVNQMYFGKKRMDYGPDYFFDDYKKQYGKTYLEDFEKIKADGSRRCERIMRYTDKGRLLDIGCGYGPFLAAAADSGFDVYGTDISENGAAWVKKELGFPAVVSSAEFFKPDVFGVDGFDAVTMWYVIEHLNELPSVLTRINSFLPLKGVFAFSTPNYNGISRLRAGGGFIASSPLDHYTIWSPQTASKLLKKYGFRVKVVRCPVIHPERFFRNGLYERLPSALKCVLRLLTVAAGRIFLLGDTFEVYAVKNRDVKVIKGEN